MKAKHRELIQYISNQEDWVDANTLSFAFSLSPRMIRNYIKEIRLDYPDLILSSHKGYKINEERVDEAARDDLSEKDEIYVIRQLLFSRDSINIYDLADELYISDSQLERILSSVKAFLSRFHLTLYRKRNRIEILGKEIYKRKLINYLIVNESSNGFLFEHEVSSFFKDDHYQEIREGLETILKNNQLTFDDYGFHSIFLHLLIIILRIKNNNFIGDEKLDESVFLKDSKAYQAVQNINDLILSLYKFHLPPAELHHLILIVSGNSKVKVYNSNFTEYSSHLDEQCISITVKILNDLRENYYLDSFSEEFKFNFILHIHNLLSRASNHLYTQNPLAQNFKDQYPLIYDMAAFVVSELNKYQNIFINDDEIAFIGFHLGAYLDKNSGSCETLNCCLLYANYYNTLDLALEKIRRDLYPLINIIIGCSVHEMNRIPSDVDLIISCIGNVPDLSIPVVQTSVLISQNDIARIRKIAEQINAKKHKEKMKEILNVFIDKQLFKKDFYCQNEEEMIKALGNECIRMDLCKEDFVENVLERERISSTSFKNRVAIPHSLKPCTKYPFLFIVSNSKPMKWGDNDVNIIVLLGISKNNKSTFTTLLDGIIQLLYEVDNVVELCKCQNYNEFIDKLIYLLN